MNLWADFDNQHLTIQENMRSQHKGRLTEQTILSSIRSWLLETYVPSYSRALAAMRFYRRCYWIDAWGVNPRQSWQVRVPAIPTESALPSEDTPVPVARGRKKETDAVLPPMLQPVVILAAQLAQESRPIALYGLALEDGSSTRKDANLRQTNPVGLNGTKANSVNGIHDEQRAPTIDSASNALMFPNESGLLRTSWLESSSALLQQLDQSPAIFLLNPCGRTLFRYEDLAPLYQRTAPTELCLLLSHKQIEAHLEEALQSAPTSSTLTSLLRTDRWKAFMPKGDEAVQYEKGVVNPQSGNRVHGFLELLVTSMQKHFLSVQPIALLVQVGPANLAPAPYTLLFATRSKDGLGCMNDAVCLYRRRLLQESYRGILSEEWFATQQQEHGAETLRTMRLQILHLGRAQRIRRWSDLRQQVLIANFGQCTLHEFDEIITDLIRTGTVRCEWRGKRPTSDSKDTGIPGINDTLLW